MGRRASRTPRRANRAAVARHRAKRGVGPTDRSALPELPTPRKRLGLFVLPLVAVATWLGVSNCSGPAVEEPSTTSTTTGAGAQGAGPPFDASHDAPADAPHDGQAGAPVDGGCAPPPGSGWTPSVDSCWRAVDWPAPCSTDIALEPELAVPPLKWEPCAWHDGCQRSVIAWDADYRWRSMVEPTVVATSGGFRVGAALMIYNDPPSAIYRSAIYREDGTPLVVWRLGPGSACGIGRPLVAHDRAWIWAGDVTTSTAAYVVAPYSALATATDAIAYQGLNQGTRGSDDLLGLWGMDGRRVTIYDRLSGVAQTFGPVAPAAYPSYGQPYPIGSTGSALVRCMDEFDTPKACIWNRDTQTIEPLVSPASEIVPRIASDGLQLAWVQNPPVHQPDGSWQTGHVWTSPFAEHSAGLSPQVRCTAPPVDSPVAAVGGGYFVMTSFDAQFHLYRLADMHHWSLPWPPQKTVYDIMYVDATEFWYYFDGGYARQRLDALGPGEACPPP
jgi:hypothetical protein